jgi:NAD(P)-dependent dehydrogenase (short-subunit alcohol dehydrogenase family)
MDLDLNGKTAIVTGGASNIGKAIAEGFAMEGANVVVADVDKKQSERVVEELNEMGDGDALFIEADVTDAKQIEQMAAKTLKRFGQIDILINNAGWTANDLCGDIKTIRSNRYSD